MCIELKHEVLPQAYNQVEQSIVAAAHKSCERRGLVSITGPIGTYLVLSISAYCVDHVFCADQIFLHQDLGQFKTKIIIYE